MQIISGRSVNGALVYCKMLCESLVRRGHQVTVVCRKNSWVADGIDPRVNVVESTLDKFSPSEIRRVAAISKQHKIDVVHSHMTRGQNFAVLLKLVTGNPVIATAHNRLFQLHWKWNDYVIANSQSTYDYHSRVNRVPASRMKVVYCCSDLERMNRVESTDVQQIRNQLRVEPDQILLGVFGEFAQRKGHIHLIQALPQIVAAISKLKVVFVGRFGRRQGHVRKMRQFILDHNLAGVTKWVGRKNNIAHYMAASDISIVPSLEEPLGLVAIESLMARTPVIASDTGGLSEIVAHEERGLLVPPGDATAIAESVIRLAGDSDLRTRLASNGHEFVRRTFEPEQLIDQVIQIYSQVAKPAIAA